MRLLGTPAGSAVEPAAADFAERMSLWFNAFDAIRLQAVHQAVRGVAPAAARAPAASSRSLDDDLYRVRSVLARAIAQDPLPASAAADADYAPFQQRHAELQRQMTLMIPPLRDHVRQAVSRVSPRLRQLALLDAALQEMLADREQALWPTAAGLLQRRFDALRTAPATDGDAAGDDWLARFRQEWHEALRAELDLRLAPVAGLLAALRNESEPES